MIRIRPNRHTLLLASVTLAIWYSGAAQSNGAIYLLAFGLASVGLISWLHARANMRGIRFEAEGVQLRQRDGDYRLPFTLVSTSARPPCGIEIAARGARAPVFVGELPRGACFRGELLIPFAAMVPGNPIAVVIRSLYPLGFLTGELRLAVSATDRHPHPLPAGDLPLPKTNALLPDAASASFAGTSRGQGSGGDFAGTRTWQPGDPPRHIDWKAVARGRPMMTKQWAGDDSRMVALDWDALTLDPAARASQLARWIQQCEGMGVRYSLSLPGKVIAASAGHLHSARCLDALASHLAAQPGAMTMKGSTAIPFVHETSAAIPAGPLRLMALLLALTTLPLIGVISWTSISMLIIAAVVRSLPRYRSPRFSAKLLFVVIGLAALVFTEAEFRSMESAVALLLVFVGGKMLESRTPRDFQVLGALGWFLCMCGLCFEQSLFWSVFAFVLAFGIAATLARARRGERGVMRPARVTFTLIAQALPLVVLLFLFFPRDHDDWISKLTRRRTGASGISGELRPGDIAQVALSGATAFRAEFPDQNQPRDLYWRCLVLWECDGLAWRRGSAVPGTRGHLAEENSTRQVITLEPHRNLWLPALDRVAEIVKGSRVQGKIDFDDTISVTEPVDSPTRFEVISQTKPLSAAALSNTQRTLGTAVPQTVGKAARDLARSFRSGAASDRAVVDAAIAHLRAQGFQYTLEPGAYGADGLDEFLFQRRLGFCEHFSAAFATLMRLADVPARVVVGFLGGERSQRGRDYWIIRQSDAHAWVEVWLDGKGWTRIDPTAELAPARLAGNLESFLSGEEAGTFAQRQGWWWRAWTETRLMWDGLNYQWYNLVVTADEDAQRQNLSVLGLDRFSNRALISLSISGGLLAMLLVFLWLKRTPRHADAEVRVWQRVCARLNKHGMVRKPGEGASAFAERAANALPGIAAKLREIDETFTAIRYAGRRELMPELRRQARALRV